MGIRFDRPELAAPGGGWQLPPPEKRRWVAKVVDAVTDPLPHKSVYCSGSPIHTICIGYDPQTKKKCTCSCHDKD